MEVDSGSRIDTLERQVARLDSELTELRAQVERSTDTAVSDALDPVSWAPPMVPTWPEPEVVPRPRGQPPLTIDSETILKWGGVALVVLAVGFAVSTAITRGWIGPELQLVGAVLVAFALIGVGLRLRPTRPNWTHALCSGGVLALFTTVASNLFLDQAPDSVAFGSTVAIAAGGSGLARLIRSEWVGVATLAGAAIGWAVIGNGEPPFVATLVWYLALTAGFVALSIERGWFAARLAAHVTGMVALLGLAGEAVSTREQVLAGVGTALLAGSLFTVPSRGDLTSIWQQLEVQLAALAAPWAFAVTFVATLEPESDAVVGWTAIGFAAVATIVAVGLRGRLRPPHHVSLLIGASITLSIGFAVLLSTTVIFVALAVQGAGLVLLGRSLDRNLRVMINAAIVVGISAIWVTGNMVEAWEIDASIGTDIAHGLIIASVATAGWFTGERTVRTIAAAVTLALVLVWTGSFLVHFPQGQALVSISWASIGTAVFVAGAVRGYSQIGATGLAVLGLTVAKLLSVDLQEVDTLWRAGLFFLVGVGLMRLGFMLPRFDRDHPPDGDDPSTVR